MKRWLAVGVAWLGLSGAAMAMAIAPERIAQIEYDLAAAAQPGTPASDWLLARGFEVWLRSAAVTAAPPLSEELTLKLETEHDRLLASADLGLMDDPVLLALRVLGCAGEDVEESECRIRRARLAAIDGDNVATAVAVMSSAWPAADSAAFLEAAALGAKASRYQPTFNLAFGQLRERFAAVPDAAVPGVPLRLEGMARADITAISWASAWALPAYQHFGQPCREAEGELLAHCLSIARQLVRGGRSTIDVMIGASLLSSHGSVQDQAEASHRRREADWLITQARDVLPGTSERVLPGQQDYFEVLVSDGELAALRALLQANGRPVAPPDEWLPPQRTGSP